MASWRNWKTYPAQTRGFEGSNPSEATKYGVYRLMVRSLDRGSKDTSSILVKLPLLRYDRVKGVGLSRVTGTAER